MISSQRRKGDRGMELCGNCKHFILTFESRGVCTEHDDYVGDNEYCNDWEEKEE